MRGWNEVVVPLDVSLMSLRRVQSVAAREASAVLSTDGNFDRRAGAFRDIFSPDPPWCRFR